MKNLVKQAKSNQWKYIVSGILVGVISYLIMYIFMPEYTCNNPKNSSEKILAFTYYMIMFVLMPMMSAMIGGIVYLFMKAKIWSDVNRHKKEIVLTRHIHHLRMMEKYIELGNKEKSELLFKQYIESKYWDQNSASFFDGAIKAKFYNKLDFKITRNGEEI